MTFSFPSSFQRQNTTRNNQTMDSTNEQFQQGGSVIRSCKAKGVRSQGHARPRGFGHKFMQGQGVRSQGHARPRGFGHKVMQGQGGSVTRSCKAKGVRSQGHARPRGFDRTGRGSITKGSPSVQTLPPNFPSLTFLDASGSSSTASELCTADEGI